MKIHLKSTGFILLWKLANMATFIPIIFFYTKAVSSLRRLENSFQHSSAEKSSWKHRLSVKLKRGRIWYYISLVFNFSKLVTLFIIFWIQIDKYSFNSEPKADLVTLPVRPTGWSSVSFHFSKSSRKVIKSSHFWQNFPSQSSSFKSPFKA